VIPGLDHATLRSYKKHQQIEMVDASQAIHRPERNDLEQRFEVLVQATTGQFATITLSSSCDTGKVPQLARPLHSLVMEV
jgi:hypothetical protein